MISFNRAFSSRAFSNRAFSSRAFSSRDRITGTSSVINIGPNTSAESIGIDNEGTTIDTGQGNDTVRGTATARASSNATAIGIQNTNGKIDTGDDRDTIMGRATANGSDATAIGIKNTSGTIDTGENRDTITGRATANGSNSALAIGIKDGDILLGGGNDRVVASARGNGINIGIQNTTINGGAGDDTFDLQSGMGTVIGGEDEDLLILEGLKLDYAFTPREELDLGVNIMRDSTTDLTVSEVELFQFAGDLGTTFTYAELFVS